MRAGSEERSSDRGVLAPEERLDCNGESSGDEAEDIVSVVLNSEKGSAAFLLLLNFC